MNCLISSIKLINACVLFKSLEEVVALLSYVELKNLLVALNVREVLPTFEMPSKTENAMVWSHKLFVTVHKRINPYGFNRYYSSSFV